MSWQLEADVTAAALELWVGVEVGVAVADDGVDDPPHALSAIAARATLMTAAGIPDRGTEQLMANVSLVS
jgi:hypothetical protein